MSVPEVELRSFWGGLNFFVGSCFLCAGRCSRETELHFI